MFLTIGYLIAFIAIFTFAFSISKIYYDTENAKNKQSPSKTSQIHTTNRYFKVILNWKFNGKDRIIEKDCCGNYYLNGIMCDCKDIITYLSSSEQYDIGMGEIMAERKIDDNNKMIKDMTSSELKELEDKKREIIKLCKKRHFINIASSISMNALCCMFILAILAISYFVWYYFCLGGMVFMSDSIGDTVMFLILSILAFVYLLDLFIRK